MQNMNALLFERRAGGACQRPQQPINLAACLGRGLAPREALRLYLDSRDTDPQRADLLLQHADTLIREERGEPDDDDDSSPQEGIPTQQET